MNWEYKTIKLGATGLMGGKVDDAQLDRTMNELGAQGWELAAAFDTEVAGGGTRDVVVIFKRPKKLKSSPNNKGCVATERSGAGKHAIG